MQVKLKVIGGRNDGREIAIPVPEFVIGRGDNAHLKPSSDLVSRNHCLLKIENGSLLISDMGSRNGTFVNGEKLGSVHVASMGDTLRVGRLQFEVLIDHGTPGNKKPKIEGVADAAARTVSGNGNSKFNEDSISDWLSNDVDEPKSLQETQQFNLENTPTEMFERTDKVDSEKQTEELDEPDSEIKESGSKKHKKYKKLPVQETVKSACSKSAADDVLKKLFNRR